MCWICGNEHAANEPCREGSDQWLGTILDGKYSIVRELGAGGMGKVYEAQHVRIGRRVAIKLLRPEFASHPEIIRRFENEARAAGSLEHENIAAVHDFGRSDNGACFLVMDFLTGEDCEKLQNREGPLPVARVVNIIIQVCRGLDVAHRADIVHRDLKPANLFVTRRADRSELVKILDFGIAKLRKSDDQAATATGQAMGTPYYMSPEQARGDKTVDQRTDIYALGVILYELLSGQRPHEGDSYLEIIYSILNKVPAPLNSVRAGLPPALVEVVRKAMSLNMTHRHASVAELGEALIPFAAGPVTPFRSQPFVAPNAKVRDLTLASEGTRSNATASTMAPLTPKTASGLRVSQSRSKLKWLLPLAAAVFLVAALAIRWAMSRSASLPSTQAAASNLVDTPVPQPTLTTPTQPVASSGVAPSGHDERSDTSALAAPAAARAAGSTPEKAPLHGTPAAMGKNTRGSATSANTPEKRQTAPQSASAPAPAASGSTPAQAPNSKVIDISREPNF